MEQDILLSDVSQAQKDRQHEEEPSPEKAESWVLWGMWGVEDSLYRMLLAA